MSKVVRLLAAPIADYVAALDAAFPTLRRSTAVVVLVTAAATWWIYVPIHELLHAYGCLWAGGEVTRLEIDALYGAAWLQRFFPFVAIGSEYAGQLTGFDTRGSDWIYLATVFLPFSLTIVVGVPLLHWAGRQDNRPLWAAAKLGAAMPIAYAPFASITGDYYEMGSILVSRVVSWLVAGFDLERWRGDDLFKVAAKYMASDGSLFDLVGLSAGFAVGVVLIFLTYAAGRGWSRLLLRH